MDSAKWNSPAVWQAVRELVPQMLADRPGPSRIVPLYRMWRSISDIDLSDNERALAWYLARSFIRISAMVQEEIAYTRLTS